VVSVPGFFAGCFLLLKKDLPLLLDSFIFSNGIILRTSYTLFIEFL
jgi:hypothetical protein